MRNEVLVVEDDADIREVIVDLLDTKGITAVAAGHGQSALDLLEQCPQEELPCVLLVDLMMPVMDGRALCAELEKRPNLAKLPVVVMSAYRDLDRLTEGLRTFAVLKKPLDWRRLVGVLQEACPELAPT